MSSRPSGVLNGMLCVVLCNRTAVFVTFRAFPIPRLWFIRDLDNGLSTSGAGIRGRMLKADDVEGDRRLFVNRAIAIARCMLHVNGVACWNV